MRSIWNGAVSFGLVSIPVKLVNATENHTVSFRQIHTEIWNGAVSFGLVSIPVKLVNATENHTVSFRQIHTEDGGRVRYRKVCELEDKEVSGDEIGKAYEDADGSLIPITDEDLASLPLPTTKTIDIVAFVPADSIDPLQMDAAYYLASGGSTAAKPYTLLREALKRGNRVALAKFAGPTRSASRRAWPRPRTSRSATRNSTSPSPSWTPSARPT
nr:Ku protein [Streptomyces sp. NEAU-H3]